MYVHFPVTIHFNPEDEGNIVLQNIGIQLPYYMVQQPIKPQINLKNYHPSILTVKYEVPQGFVIGPLLFIIDVSTTNTKGCHWT
jgi:hypothetical protein